ncbi:MAG: hypothetical protein K8T90_16900 [Planctomycetes bacterium]|nr:hypothetical protein [Planctomycetota bacterium]
MGDDLLPDGNSAKDDLLSSFAKLSWREVTIGALVATPGVLGIHAAVWGLGRVFGTESNPRSWGPEIFGAALVSFFAMFLLAAWGRRRHARNAR